ncbi:hypothetical protein HIM_11562 [Hirsutella minnesotensis 3608]|uniref:DDE-1 domain-containing protein n=2 Tax=Hirsutella minnesotensis 3608 TaxID=1043627 RepID=A0A0F7ZFF5_9HYPO|nr:hypothetical protein HIM_11562 [Hirsutella minnesotensis 3608]
MPDADTPEPPLNSSHMTLAKKAELIKKWADNKQKHVRKKRDKNSHVYWYMQREAIEGSFYSEYKDGPKIFQEFRWTCIECLQNPSTLRKRFQVLESNRRGVTSGMGDHLKIHRITKESHYARINGYGRAIGGGDYTEADAWSGRPRQRARLTAKESIRRWFVKHRQPFSVVETPAFQEMFLAHNTTCAYRSRITLRNHIHTDFVERREKLKIEFEYNCSTISFTLDIWTAPNRVPIFAIIAHWITPEFEEREEVIEFIELQESHTGEQLAKIVESTLEELRLKPKLLAITGDNAGNNGTLCQSLYDSLKTKFDDKVRSKIEEYDIAPCNTYNMDEKGFLLGVVNRTKRVFSLNQRKQGKLLGASQDGSRSWITLVACVCQDMTSLPPFLIYQGKPGHVQDTWLTEFDPEHQSAFFTTSDTGWTNHELGKEWLVGVFDRFTKAKARNGRDYRLLITDGHSSHINMEFLDWCDQHRIIVAVFPPHSTHRLQPLDVSLFGPLSTAYTNQLIGWMEKTQGLVGLSKREFWTLFWNALGASFTPENIASGWMRTGLLPFNPEVILSQIVRKENNGSDTDSGSEDSGALQQPTARELRRLIDKIVNNSAPDAEISSRKLVNTVESLQSEVELLRYENKGLRETIIREKQRRQRGTALKDFLFDRGDPNSAQVFSPQKVAQAREKKAAIELRKKEEASQKELQRVQRQQRAEEQKEQALERKRQREEKKERKSQEKEARKQEKEAKRQQQDQLKGTDRGKGQQRPQSQHLLPEIRGKNAEALDEIIVALPTSSEFPTPSQSPIQPTYDLVKKPIASPSQAYRTQRPSLVVESDREMVVAYRGLGRPQRNSKRPQWLKDCEIG